MSGSLHAWYSLRDLESLADRGVTLSGELDVGKLTRLKSLLHSDFGSVRATLRFRQRGRRLGGVGARLSRRGRARVPALPRAVSARARGQSVDVVLIDGASLPATAPAGIEPFELEGGRLQPAQLIEDELIVAIPFVPKHARIEDCGSLARQLAGQDERP